MESLVADDLYKAVGKCHEKTGNTKSNDFFHFGHLQTQGSSFQMKNCPFSREKTENPECGAKLRQNGGDSGS